MSPKMDTQKSAKSATVTGKAVKGFTDEERAAMKERALSQPDPDHRDDLLDAIHGRHFDLPRDLPRAAPSGQGG